MAWFVSLGLMAIALVALARVRASFLSWTAAVAGLAKVETAHLCIPSPLCLIG